MLKYKTCYATQKFDVGKSTTPFRIRLKPNAQLLTQRPSKVPIHYCDKLNALLKEIEMHKAIKQIGSSPRDKPVNGTKRKIFLLKYQLETQSNLPDVSIQI